MFISSPSLHNMFGLKPEMSSRCHRETILHLSEITSTNGVLDVNVTVKEESRLLYLHSVHLL